MTTSHHALQHWVSTVAQLTAPAHIHWCTGSETEYQTLVQHMLQSGELVALNPTTHPRCYLHRSAANDVARVEQLTFVCSETQADAGPNNNWLDPTSAHAKMDALFKGIMQGRTLYVIPYCLGPLTSPHARCGVEITDSPYVVLNMRLMTHMGTAALQRIEREGHFVKGLHSLGDLDPEKRFIMHFPETMSIKSIGSGYGGNALLGKKCHALRIASWQARQEGWLAEHMLIVGVQNPQGKVHYIAAAFPSACGKTNLAMLVPPANLSGWKIWTVGDDICWLHLDATGQLRAINPETGYFGVVPGTNAHTNPNAFAAIQHDTLFTNVALTATGQPWWEGLPGTPTLNWQGQPIQAGLPAAHPNARFTVAAQQNASYSSVAEDPAGVPISAILFGGRRRDCIPLVTEAHNWTHGVLMGASMASQTTAAAAGTVGVVRRDPMAMRPFCGYHFGDYWQHWLSFATRTQRLPKIYQVNWFRQDAQDHYLWPGFSDNLRVLQWIFARCEATVGAQSTAIGHLPYHADLNLSGLKLSATALHELLRVDPLAWRQETQEIAAFLQQFGDRVPTPLHSELQALQSRL